MAESPMTNDRVRCSIEYTYTVPNCTAYQELNVGTLKNLWTMVPENSLVIGVIVTNMSSIAAICNPYVMGTGMNSVLYVRFDNDISGGNSKVFFRLIYQ